MVYTKTQVEIGLMGRRAVGQANLESSRGTPDLPAVNLTPMQGCGGQVLSRIAPESTIPKS